MHKRAVKLLRMKAVTPKKKGGKREKDIISETISFVIKGKLTPIKPVRGRKSAIKKKDMASTKTKTPVKPTKKAAKPVKKELKPKKKPKVKKVAIKEKPKEVKQEVDKDQDLKTKQTIEKLLKQANKALRNKTPKKKPPKKKPEPEKKPVKEAPVTPKRQPKRKSESTDDSTSDDATLAAIIKKDTEAKRKKIKIKSEPPSDGERKPPPKRLKKPPSSKPNLLVMKKRLAQKQKADAKTKKMKLFNFWNGPKRHRVASLNALAKVHCLYENETRGNLIEPTIEPKQEVSDEVACTRKLRSVPGLRGKHWDMDTTSSSEENSGCESTDSAPRIKIKKEPKKAETITKPEPKKRRNRSEILMDLKDMVVRKRMASLNASAILAASYSVEKKRSPKTDQSSEPDSSDYFHTDTEDDPISATKVKSEEDSKMIEVCATPNKKVAVILNQDTDVTITGVYVNSTTRSTHHEGYCSIAGMQYRISATSHTQTASTAVATETLLQSSASSAQENSNSESLPSCKSYTPLDALSNMQPPPGPGIQGHQHMGPPPHVLPMPPRQISPSRRHGCSSAFSAPHAPPYPPPPMPGEPGYVHGYYQPAGPLISVPHGHTQPPPPPPPVTKSVPLSETSPTSTSPIHQPPPAPSSNCDSSDSEVIITSVTAGTKTDTVPPPQQPPSTSYRYTQYPGTPPGYPYPYPSHYYPTPPPAPSYPPHHDLCYSAPYLHHKYPPTSYRRFLPSTQYYPPNPPDIYTTPTAGPAPQSQQVVTAPPPSSASGSTYQPPPSGPPPAIMETYPPPTLVEAYPHPPHYYSGYGPAPPPSCYTHSPGSRSLPFINATYQSCPCPMQSCPKNGLTGPLTGDSKRSNISSIAKDSMPLPPVALALPLEPASATGPPSPARGSAGMPPPPSPAGATYQPPPTKQEETDCMLVVEMKRKARVGKQMVRNHMAQNTMLLMCNPTQRTFPSEVKREIESPKEKEPEAKKEICSDDETKTITEADLTDIERIPEPTLKTEDTEDKIEQTEPALEVSQCTKTVAENVKVKNMKRKLSLSKEPEMPPKKIIKPSGSYKDLIKRDTNTLKINNGKRKLILGSTAGVKKGRPKAKKPTKRKLVGKPEALTPTKRFKSTRNLERKNKRRKQLPVNSKSKKLAPALLDSLIAKNTSSVRKDVISDETPLPPPRTCVLQTEKCKSTKPLPIRKNKRKTKSKEQVPVVPRIPRRASLLPKWSNGWAWEGEAFESKVFLNSDETTVVRKCYPAMRHIEGDSIEVRDCVLLKAGPRKNDLPFVAKIAYLWENPDDGEMMMSLLWYYRPEHTEHGRLPDDRPDEVFASRHKDSNSVACIDDKCYVLTYHEYCRYRKDLRRVEEGIEETPPTIPVPEPYPRYNRQPPSPNQVSPDMVFFCRRVYDFRQKKIAKNPS